MGAGVSTEDSDEEQPHLSPKGVKNPPTASKPWVELNDPGNVMMTLGRRRVEWSVRMGVIYCATMLYAVSDHVSSTTVFGTWPILANFYGTFAIASSVGGAVTGCIEMARGCTIGTLLAIATVEVTVAADADLNNLAQSTGLLSGILGALFVAVTITPILTKSEKQMLLFCLVSGSYNGLARLRSRHEPVAGTLAARYDVWYHPFLELVSSLMGMAIGLVFVILPYGMYAVHELRARMAYQARAISVLARTQHVIAQTNSDAAIAQSAQITETLRSNALHMHDLRRNAMLEVFWSPTQIHLLRNTFEHLDRQLPMLLSKSIAVDKSRGGQSVDDQPDQVAFLELMDPSWDALELAVTSVNDEMILSEMERREPSDACWSELDSCIQNFGEKVQLARRQVCYTQDCGPPTAESIERHTRRMAHLFFVEQHARTVLAQRPVHRQPVLEWTCAGVATFIVQTVCTLDTGGGRAWRRPNASEVVRAVKLSMALIVCMLFEVVDELRDSHLMERQGATMLFTVIFVQCNSVGSSKRITSQRVYGTLLGAVYAMMLLGLIADVCDTEMCSNTILVVGLTVWGAICGPFLIASATSADYQSYVACFTAPIIAHGFGPEQRHSSVANRALASVLGVCVFYVCENSFGRTSARVNEWVAQRSILHHLRDALEYVTKPMNETDVTSDQLGAPGSRGISQRWWQRPTPLTERRRLDVQPYADGAKPGLDAVAYQLSMLSIANAEQDLDKPPFPLYAYREILLIERRVLEMCVSLRIAWATARHARLDIGAAGRRATVLKRVAAMMRREAARAGLRAWREKALQSVRIEDRASALRRRGVARTISQGTSQSPESKSLMDTLTKAAKGNPDQLKAWLPTFESAIVTALHEWAKKTSEVGDNWGGFVFAKTHDAEDDCSNVVLPLLAEHRAHETDGQMVTIAWQKELHRLFTCESTEQLELPPAIAAGASTLKLVHDKMTPQLYQLGVRLRDLRFRTGPTMARVARISDFA